MGDRFVGPPDEPDRIRLVSSVHRGSEGEVFRGSLLSDASSGEGTVVDVAVKRLSPDLDRVEWLDRWHAQRRLLDELHAADQSLRIVRVIDLFQGPAPHRRRHAGQDRSTYLLSDWIPGRRFDDWSADPAVGFEERRSTLGQLSGTVAGLHRCGVIHRDLSPGNVIVDRAGRPTLIDFGIAVRCPENGWVHESAPIGTDGFRSPEATDGHWSMAADRFALDRLVGLAMPPT